MLNTDVLKVNPRRTSIDIFQVSLVLTLSTLSIVFHHIYLVFLFQCLGVDFSIMTSFGCTKYLTLNTFITSFHHIYLAFLSLNLLPYYSIKTERQC